MCPPKHTIAHPINARWRVRECRPISGPAVSILNRFALGLVHVFERVIQALALADVGFSELLRIGPIFVKSFSLRVTSVVTRYPTTCCLGFQS